MGFEVYIAGFAAFLLALNQGLKDAPYIRAKFPALNLPGWVNYVPFPIFAFAIAIHFLSPGDIRQTKSTAPTVSGLPIEAIAKSVENGTNYQSEQQLKPFTSMSAKVSGSVRDIVAEPGNFAIVFLDGTFESRNVKLSFREEISEISSFSRGDNIKAYCYFGSVDKFEITLNRCTLKAPATDGRSQPAAPN